MSRDWLAEARERCDAATPGPWCPRCDHEDSLQWLCNDKDAALILGGPERDVVAEFEVPRTEEEQASHTIHPVAKVAVAANISFIAAARTDLPRALAVIEAADRLAKAVWEHGVPDGIKEVEDALAAYRKTRHGGTP